MKSRLEKVLDKMPNKKVDLKAQKVALGASDMYQNAVDGSKVLGMIYDSNSELSNIKATYQSGVEIAKDWLVSLESDMDDFSQKANELGIDPNNQDFYQYSKQVVEEAESTIRYGEDVINALNSLGA
jgi:hypothetical protein